MKTFIKNRDGNEIAVVVEGPEKAGKLAFVMHGLGGNKEQTHIRAMIEAFLESGFTVVSFDTVHTFGESKGGSYEDATVTNYYADLEDVISWASSQKWYSEPFVLCGHSLGGISTALFTENHFEKVMGLAPISTVVSGKLSAEINVDELEKWKKEGILVTMSYDGKREKRLKWSHMVDRLKYDLLPKAGELTMPVLMIVGEHDESTPLKHQQILYDVLSGKKELHIIKGAPHTFYETDEREEVKELVKTWASKL